MADVQSSKQGIVSQHISSSSVKIRSTRIRLPNGPGYTKSYGSAPIEADQPNPLRLLKANHILARVAHTLSWMHAPRQIMTGDRARDAYAVLDACAACSVDGGL